MSNINEINFQDKPSNGNNDPENFYETFKQRLEDVETFPQDYGFKFIIKKNDEQIAAIKDIFKNTKAEFSFADSKTGKYTSVRVTAPVQNADEVIGFYKEAGKLKDVFVI